MRSASRVLVLVLAAIGMAAMLIPSAGSAVDGPAAVELAKKGKAGKKNAKSKAKDRAKAKKKAKKAKRKAKRAKKKATKAIRDGLFTGTRGDGAVVDWTLCRNGKYEMATTSYGSTGVSRGTGWKVSVAKQTKRGFWAIVNYGKSAYVAISKNRKRWKVGIEYFDTPSQMGPAERINARKICKNAL